MVSWNDVYQGIGINFMPDLARPWYSSYELGPNQHTIKTNVLQRKSFPGNLTGRSFSIVCDIKLPLPPFLWEKLWNVQNILSTVIAGGSSGLICYEAVTSIT